MIEIVKQCFKTIKGKKAPEMWGSSFYQIEIGKKFQENMQDYVIYKYIQL